MLAVQPEHGAPLDKAYSARFVGTIESQQIDEKGARRADDGLFYIEARSNGETVKFLVDTGASYVVLSHRDAKKLPVTKLNTGREEHLQTVAGRASVDWVMIKELQVYGRTLKGVRAAVPRNDIGISLLGQNALAQFSAIHINGDHLALKF